METHQRIQSKYSTKTNTSMADNSKNKKIVTFKKEHSTDNQPLLK